MHAGELDQAEILAEEAAAITAATGAAPLFPTRPMLLAIRGAESEALDLIGSLRDDAVAQRQAIALALLDGASAMLFNGLARYEEASAAAERACAHDELALHGPSLLELIEGAARCGRTDLAEVGIERLAARTQASGTDWALGVEARSRALIAEGPGAADL